MGRRFITTLASAAKALLVGVLAAVGVGLLVFLVRLVFSASAMVAADAARRAMLVVGALAMLVGAIGIVLRSEPKGGPRPFGLDWRVALILAGAGVELAAGLLDLAIFPLI